MWEESPNVRATCFSAYWRGFVFIARLRDKTVMDFGGLFLVVNVLRGALLFFVWKESPNVRATCFSACWRGFVFIARLRDKTVVDLGWLFLGVNVL